MQRRLLTLAIFLLLGAILNVAMAWGCATWSALKLVSRPWVGQLTEVDQRWWQQVVPAGAAPRASAVWRSRGFGCDSLLILGDRSGEAVIREDPSGQVIFGTSVNATLDRATLVRSGWPWRSGAGERWDLGISLLTPFPMLGHKVTTWRDADLETSAVSFDRPTRLGGSSFRLLPLRPIWTGFAINTLFYAALLWPLICGPSALRRHIRRKRGLCVSCGYDLRHAEHDACPECGGVSGPAAEVVG